MVKKEKMKETILKINSKKQCLSCGLCYSVCPKDAIRLEYNKKQGLYLPTIMKNCISCGMCLHYCPTVGTNESVDEIGIYKKIYLAHSINNTVRQGATSGGVINEVVRFLLEYNEIDACVLVCIGENPIESKADIITRENSDDLEKKPRNYASRYTVVPVLSKLKECIKLYTNIAIVGTPCQIAAAKKYIIEQHLDLNCIYLGISCSSGISYKATEQYKKVMSRKNSKFFYRGNGWPGENTLVSKNGTISYNHPKSLFERMFSSQVFKNQGCYNCKDQFAEKADISFCDFWNREELDREKLGNSVTIIRSELGNMIIEQMKKKCLISIEKVLNADEVIESQKAVLIQKKGNVKNKMSYKILKTITYIMFETNIYRLFTYRHYDFLSRLYSHIIWKCDDE